jgi:5-dehydro-4-deoxyglucarate dehydratase
VAAATALPVIVYQRDNAVFTPATVVELARTEGIIGFKDGLGDLDLMQRIVSTVRAEVPGDFLYFNGLPTAEQTQLAYRGIGITLYSSAVFCFVPEIALAFHRALATGDDTTANRSWTASTCRSSNCAPRAAVTPSRSSRRVCGCGGWTSARSARR